VPVGGRSAGGPARSFPDPRLPGGRLSSNRPRHAVRSGLSEHRRWAGRLDSIARRRHYLTGIGTAWQH
jgi:hypothetical protein